MTTKQVQLIEDKVDNVEEDMKLGMVALARPVYDLVKSGDGSDSIYYAMNDTEHLWVITDAGMPLLVADEAREQLKVHEVNGVGLLLSLDKLGICSVAVNKTKDLFALQFEGKYLFEELLSIVNANSMMAFGISKEEYIAIVQKYLGVTTEEHTEEKRADIINQGLGVVSKADLTRYNQSFIAAVKVQNDITSMEKIWAEEEKRTRSFLSYVVNAEKVAKTRGTEGIDAYALIKRFLKEFGKAERIALLSLNARYKLLDMTLYGNEEFEELVKDPKVGEYDADNVLERVVRDPVLTKLQAAHDGKKAVFALDSQASDSQPTAFVLLAEQARDMPAHDRYINRTPSKNMLRQGLGQVKAYTQVVAMALREEEKEHISFNPWLHDVINSKCHDDMLANMTKLHETVGNNHINRFQFNTIEAMKDPKLRVVADGLHVVKSPLGSVIGDSQPPVAHLCAQLCTRSFSTTVTKLHEDVFAAKLKSYNTSPYINYEAQCDALLKSYDQKEWGMVPTRANAGNIFDFYEIYSKHVKDFNVGVFNDSSKYFESLHHGGLVPNTKTLLQMFIETTCAGWVGYSKSALAFMTTLMRGPGMSNAARPMYHEGDDATLTDRNAKVRAKYNPDKKVHAVFIDLQPITQVIIAGGNTEADRYDANRHGRLKHYVEDIDRGQMAYYEQSMKEAVSVGAKVWIGLLDPLTLVQVINGKRNVRMIFPPIPPFRTLIPTVVEMEVAHGTFMPKSKVTLAHVAKMLAYMASSIVYAGHEYVTYFKTLRLEHDAQYARFAHFELHCAGHLKALRTHLDSINIKWAYDDLSALKRGAAAKGPSLRLAFEDKHNAMAKMMEGIRVKEGDKDEWDQKDYENFTEMLKVRDAKIKRKNSPSD